jgi:CarD family transcriptional regulator
MFSLNEKVVYPGHGVAKINRIICKNIAGKKLQFFELTFLNKDMTILVPTKNLDSVGIRALSSDTNIETIFKILTEPAADSCSDNTKNSWNKRHKDYQCKLRSGDLQEICKIYRDLKYIANQKELSFGEKHLLNETETLLAQEISVVRQVGHEMAVQQLRSLCQRVYHSPVSF